MMRRPVDNESKQATKRRTGSKSARVSLHIMNWQQVSTGKFAHNAGQTSTTLFVLTDSDESVCLHTRVSDFCLANEA